MLASLLASHRPALTGEEYATDKGKTRKALKRVRNDLLGANGNASGVPKLNTRRTSLIEDIGMHLKLRRLWQSDSMEKAMRTYEQAVTTLKKRKGAFSSDPRIVNNIAALHHIDGNLRGDCMKKHFEELVATGTDDDTSDAASTIILYNLARVYEDAGDSTMAKEAYDKLWTRRLEYIGGASCFWSHSRR